MRIVPFRELEEFAREQYRRHYGDAPEPKVINVEPLVSFAAPRALAFGGCGYWVPPLSYEDGVELMVAANAIGDLIKSRSPRITERVRFSARLIKPLVIPLGWRRRFWRLARNPFVGAPPADVERFLREMLYVPDESPNAPPAGRVTVDLIDGLFAFMDRFKSRPRTWKEYVYGIRYISRANAREDLRAAVAARVSQADKNGWKEYERDQRAAAGW